MKLIFISGPSGSGKTTLSNQIIKKNKNGFVLSTDNYYKTGLISKLLSNFVEGFFDRRISFNYKLLFRDLTFICKNNKITHTYDPKSSIIISKRKTHIIITCYNIKGPEPGPEPRIF